MASTKTQRPPYPRTRNSGPFRDTRASVYGYISGAAPTPPPDGWQYFGVVGRDGEIWSMSDTVTPGYKKLISQGRVVNNGMSRVKIKITPTLLSGHTVSQVKGTNFLYSGTVGWRKANYNLHGDIMSYVFGPIGDTIHTSILSKYQCPFSIESLVTRANIEARNRVEPAKSQTLVTLAEGQKTLNMIADRAQKLASVIQAVKTGNVKRLEFMFPGKRTKNYPKRLVLWDASGRPMAAGDRRYTYSHLPLRRTPSKMDDATRLWLEYRYGWTPLVHDIVDSLKAVYADDLRKQLISRDRLKAIGSASQSGTSQVGFSPLREFFGYSNAVATAVHEVTAKAYIVYEHSSSSDGLARRLNDFGSFDVPRAIWELVPWSFVIDWFIPIGDWLGALTPKVGVNVIASGYSVKHTLRVDRRVSSWVSSPASGDTAWTPAPLPIGSGDSLDLTVAYRVVPLPLPAFPPIQVNLNLKRMVDAVALMRGVHSRNLRT